MSTLTLSQRPAALESSQRPIALEASILRIVPMDLMPYIASFLPPDSAASFSLCCWTFYYLLGKQYLKPISMKNRSVDDDDPMEEDTHKFLRLLERDLPNYIACALCKKLHAIDEAERYQHSNPSFHQSPHDLYKPKERRRSLVKADKQTYSTFHYHLPYNFSATLFEMTMKLHHQGLDCSKLLKLISDKGSVYLEPTRMTTALARIVDGSFLIRMQELVRLPSSHEKWTSCDLSICHHIHIPTLSHESDETKATFPWYLRQHDGGEKLQFQALGQLVQCDYCLTEFCADVKSVGNGEVVVSVTKWLDLSASHIDVRWDKSRVSWEPIEYEGGSVYARFEGGKHEASFPYKSVLSAKGWEKLLSLDRLIYRSGY